MTKLPKRKWTKEIIIEEWKKENCKLISDYIDTRSKFTYEYEGKQYTTTWNKWWNNKSRPYKNGGNRHKLTLEEVIQLFENENCELLDDKHVNNKTNMKYKYDGKEYTVTLNYIVHLLLYPKDLIE